MSARQTVREKEQQPGTRSNASFPFFPFPLLGCGVGLRSPHYTSIVDVWPEVDFFEAISENYMDTVGRPVRVLEKVRGHYPVILHGTSMSLGSTDPLSPEYLERLKALVERIDPVLVSDHLCWSGVDGHALHDLLPLPFTEEAIRHLVSRISYVQEFLGRRILIENVSTYVTFRHSTIPEWEFLAEIARRSGCGILLDLNNIYVNAFNHGFDPFEYIRGVPAAAVGQFHLAGHTDMGGFLFDTHSAPVLEKVWQLYHFALERFGPVSTLIEWDEHIPPFGRLMEEVASAKRIYRDFENAPKPSAAPVEIREVRSLENAGAALKDVQHWIRFRVQPARERDRRSGELLNPQGGVPGDERMDVYSNGYLARMHESLAEVYEAVRHFLGADEFIHLAEAYAFEYPSKHYNLNYAGRHLAQFLRGHALPGFPFLADLAELEWRIWEAFHAFDAEPLGPAQLAGVAPEDWENLRLVFQPSVSILVSPWPVLDLWMARKQTPEQAQKIPLESRPQTVLIGRRADQVRCEPLETLCCDILRRLLAGQTLGQVCEEVEVSAGDELMPSVSACFTRWVQDGLIARYEIPPSA